MKTSEAIDALSAIAQDTRLETFRLLVKHEPGGLLAGEIARLLDVPHNTLSSHLATLARAGLVTAERRSRTIVYRVKLGTVRNLVMFLLRDCCNGRPDLCSPLVDEIARVCSPQVACGCRENESLRPAD